MGGRHSRDKGLNFEREIARVFREDLGYLDAKRHLEYIASEAKGFDLDGVDPFKIQCKRNKTYAPISKIEEVQLEDDSHIEVLITRGDKKPAMIVMPLAKWTLREQAHASEIAYLKSMLKDAHKE